MTFDLFGKLSVKGEDQHPLYKWLTTYPENDVAGDVPWNFTKYLIDREGKVVARFGPRTLPEDPKVIEALEKTLATEPNDG